MQAAAAGHGNGEGERLADLPFGRAGMWWFLASEIMVFGGLLGSFILSRFASGGWEQEMSHVNTRLAAINTLILVTSSFTIVEAHAAVSAGNRKRAQRFLFVTVAFGLLFLCNKGYEYSGEIRHGILPSSGLFWSYYYLMTGLHGLHVLGGVIVNLCLAIAAGSPTTWAKVQHRVEYAGLYWHFVDVVWIFLFPLVYLT
ncbi:MAG: cytochrome c oxidase subunit 3 [Candidatus Binatia bacterium]